jgi:hypothetical protein
MRLAQIKLPDAWHVRERETLPTFARALNYTLCAHDAAQGPSAPSEKYQQT